MASNGPVACATRPGITNEPTSRLRPDSAASHNAQCFGFSRSGTKTVAPSRTRTYEASISEARDDK